LPPETTGRQREADERTIMSMASSSAIQTFSVSLPSSPDAPHDARHQLGRLTGTVPAAVMADAELLVSELVTTSFLHAGLGPADAVEMNVTLTPERIEVSVRDHGHGFRVPGTPASTHGGLGLLVVDRVASRWGVRGTGETEVWFHLDIPAG
jgi:anti-sigma regulatory factor (Ser/Thr protein kinase)